MPISLNGRSVKCPRCTQTFRWLRKGHRIPSHRAVYADGTGGNARDCTGIGRTVYPMEETVQ